MIFFQYNKEREVTSDCPLKKALKIGVVKEFLLFWKVKKLSKNKNLILVNFIEK